MSRLTQAFVASRPYSYLYQESLLVLAVYAIFYWSSDLDASTHFERVLCSMALPFKTNLLFTCPRSLPAVDTILFTTLYSSSRYWFFKTYSGFISCAPARYSRSLYLLSLKDESFFLQELRCTASHPEHEIYHIGYLCHTFFVLLSAWYHPAIVHSSAWSAHIIYQTNHKCEHIMCAILASMYISYVLLDLNLIFDFILYITAILPRSIWYITYHIFISFMLLQHIYTHTLSFEGRLTSWYEGYHIC